MSNEQKLREALQEAATSLETISRLAGRGTYPNGDDTYMGTFMEVRGYATSRAGVARQALATTEPAVNQQLTTEPFDEREAFANDTKDAERYRWLRDIAPTLGNRAPHVTQYPGQSFDKTTYLDATKVGLDAAIDAAMAQGVKG